MSRLMQVTHEWVRVAAGARLLTIARLSALGCRSQRLNQQTSERSQMGRPRSCWLPLRLQAPGEKQSTPLADGAGEHG
ncbi:MAG: hypothetical protein NZ700_09845 [Gemmataceae bacterium]|nr:hypothetical protein [Gemmataceae bacterium]MDW8264898.1 hypothetical protein [Gemmataceae bacterium]